MWTCFSISVFAWGQARSKLGGVDTSILHHVFLLLFIMFLSIIMLFGVILMPFISKYARYAQGGRILAARNLDLKKLHQATYSAQLQMSWNFTRIFMEYIRIIGENYYQRGATRWAQPTWARQAPLARPGGSWPPRPTSGAHLLVYKSFWPRKNKERTFGTKHRRLEAELGQEHFCPPAERFCRGTSLLEREIIVVIITNDSPFLGRAISINIFTNTIPSQTLVHLSYSILLPEL